MGRVHISWMVGWLCLGFLCGVGAIAFFNHSSFASSIFLITALCILVAGLIFKYVWIVLFVFCAGVLFGVWRGSLLRAELGAYEPYYNTTVSITGRVSQDASFGSQGDQRLNLTDIKINNQFLKGEVWVSTGKVDIKRGDTVTAHGKFGPGFGTLAGTMYRAQIKEIVRPNPGDLARRVRDKFANGVRTGIPDPAASLGLGYLVGQKTALPKELEEDIKAVGLTHAVVASGYNLTILVVFSRRLFLRISKYMATVASIILILSFMLVTGLSPSMSRAGLVASLGLLVWYYGRAMHPFVLLTFAAAITVMIQPSYLWGDLGWHLSFSAFIGVIVLAPLVHHYFWGIEKNPGLFRDLIVGTLCAQIVTTPVILLSFGLFAVYALPANLLVLPLVPLAMLGTFIAGIAGLLVPALAVYFAYPATLMLTYSVKVIGYVANLPNAQIELMFNPSVMIASYIALGVAITYLKRRTKHDFRNPDSTNDIY